MAATGDMKASSILLAAFSTAFAALYSPLSVDPWIAGGHV